MPKNKIIKLKNSYHRNGEVNYYLDNVLYPLIESDNVSGFYRNILDAIISIFEYADALKEMQQPHFIRFDFWKGCTKDKVLRFFKNSCQHHARNNKKFLYLAVCESRNDNIHFHAFCIVSGRDYRHRRDIIKELNRQADIILKSNVHGKKLFIPTKPHHPAQLSPNESLPIQGKYNFYPISKASNTNNSSHIRVAFWAASYLAKIDQTPPKNIYRGKRLFTSKLKPLSKNEIRAGFSSADTAITKHLFLFDQ